VSGERDKENYLDILMNEPTVGSVSNILVGIERQKYELINIFI